MNRVLVTGSRDWPHRGSVRAALYRLAENHDWNGMVVVHGACPTGADLFAGTWARQYADRDVTDEPHPAEWRVGDVFDAGAGYRRNAEMVELGANVCLAFAKRCSRPKCTRPGLHYSHGTTHCADLAEQAGIPTYRWTAP